MAEELTTRSPRMRAIIELATELHATNSPILITGERGTGKKQFAQFIKNASSRKSTPFLHVNCKALSPSLLEKELLGHEEGLFHESQHMTQGIFEQCHGGTLLLEEIGHIERELQARLLKVLEDKVCRRMGGVKDLPADVRVIATTNLNIKQIVDQGQFDEKLFYRLKMLNIQLPALRERSEDIPEMIDLFLSRCRRKFRKDILGYSHDFLQKLTAHHWPGNISELKNVIERCFLLSRGIQLDPSNLSLQPKAIPGRPRIIPLSKSSYNLDDHLIQQEIDIISETLERFRGNKSRVAKFLCIKRTTLESRIKKYRIKVGKN